MLLKLTQPEARYLEHRASAPDAVADALEDCNDRTEVEDVCTNMAARLNSANRHGITLAIDTELERDVLAELVEGSTFLPASNGFCEVPHQSWTMARRLADKVSAVVGRTVTAPDY